MNIGRYNIDDAGMMLLLDCTPPTAAGGPSASNTFGAVYYMPVGSGSLNLLTLLGNSLTDVLAVFADRLSECEEGEGRRRFEATEAVGLTTYDEYLEETMWTAVRKGRHDDEVKQIQDGVWRFGSVWVKEE